MKYRVYTVYNSADTCRDISELHYDELGYFNKLCEANKVVDEYIQNNFMKNWLQKELPTLTKRDDGTYFAQNLIQWGKTIFIEPIGVCLNE